MLYVCLMRLCHLFSACFFSVFRIRNARHMTCCSLFVQKSSISTASQVFFFLCHSLGDFPFKLRFLKSSPRSFVRSIPFPRSSSLFPRTNFHSYSYCYHFSFLLLLSSCVLSFGRKTIATTTNKQTIAAFFLCFFLSFFGLLFIIHLIDGKIIDIVCLIAGYTFVLSFVRNIF